MPLTHNMRAVGKRVACYTEFEAGVNADGVIQYLDLTFYCDCGWSFNDSSAGGVADTLTSLYRHDRWNITGYSTLTDTASHTWCRAPGTTEATAIIEHIMERIAFATKKDPTDVRIANLDPEHSGIKDMITTFKKDCNFDERKTEIAKFNSENAWKKKALKLSIMSYPIEYSWNFPVTISVYHADATVEISHGGIEMGQGINTKVAQVCAYTLKIPYEKVSVRGSNSFVSPNAMASNGSITSESLAFATVKACTDLLNRFEDVKKDMNQPTWEEVVKAAYEKGINLQAIAMTSPLDKLQGYHVYGVCASETELDVLTGQRDVTRVDLLEDTGVSLSPVVDVGQVHDVCASETELDVLTGQRDVTRVDLLEDTGVSLSPVVDVGQVHDVCASETELDALTGQCNVTRVDLLEDTGVSLSPVVDVGQVHDMCASETELDALTGQCNVTRVDLLEDTGVSLSPVVDVGQVHDVCASETELDVLTGQRDVTRVDLLEDTGVSLSPVVDVGQVHDVCASETELDVLTGQRDVTRVDLLEDTGVSLSPVVDVGQIEGAFVMGLGLWTSEQLEYEPGTGRLLTDRTWTYKPCGARDIPQDFRISFQRDSRNTAGVLRSKGMNLGRRDSRNTAGVLRSKGMNLGRVATHRPHVDLQARDIPQDFRISFQGDSRNTAGVLRSKGMNLGRVATNRPHVDLREGHTAGLPDILPERLQEHCRRAAL
ncbi:molybdopterin-binding domain of aldehyde dehydrogenase domain-containing protein [Phthorimaea operculella]|nr:molybdopterin-binding domain of aldehyde dehydrogenase domain-containing protein [Phthorimaea operculella]